MAEPATRTGEKKHKRVSPQLRIVVFVVLLVLIAGAGSVINANWRVQAKALEVYVNGTLVGVVAEEDREAIIAAVEAEFERIREDNELEVGLTTEITFSEVISPERDEMSSVLDRIIGSLEYGLQAAAIVVDGEEIVILPCKDDAEELLAIIRDKFVKSNSILIEKVEFQEDVAVVAKFVTVEEVTTDKQSALNVLLHGSERILQHTVTRGESFWSIANLHRLSVNAIQAANPNIRPETLQIGQKLNLKIDEPYVRVETVEQIKYSEAIPFPTTYVTDSSLWTWQSVVRTAGVRGSREIVARVVSVNGKEESREILSTAVVREPSTQVVARGTKSAPSMSTGSYLWPTEGRVTSPFGPRWGGFHQGVDIGAPTGTPIKAADSGVVSFAGWNGGYGYMVRIEHGNGSATLYAHASRLLVTQNQTVNKGDTIALVGNTGNSYGPHLHFEIRLNDKPVNPLNYFR